MITSKEYRNNPEKFWKGKKVRTLREMSNGYFAIPTGTILIITRKYKGFTLEGVDVCDKCKIGRKIFCSRVLPSALSLQE